MKTKVDLRKGFLTDAHKKLENENLFDHDSRGHCFPMAGKETDIRC
jgi:hypothetical protein